MFVKKFICSILLLALAAQAASAGISIVRSNGITLTGLDGVNYIGTSGITLTGLDSFLKYKTNGITLTGLDGITLTGVDGLTQTGADGVAFTGTNGARINHAAGMTLANADGITLTGLDGITLTGVDGTQHVADSLIVRQADGITLTGVDGITLTGVDGLQQVAEDGITLTGVDGITLTGLDGITLTGVDSITGINAMGAAFTLIGPDGITLTGVDGAAITKATGITLTGVDGITLTGVDSLLDQVVTSLGLQSIDPDLALLLNTLTDDSSVNAVVAFHNYPTAADLDQLRALGILGGTLYKALPMIVLTTTRAKLIELSRLPNVRSIYGNRTLSWNSDPYFKQTQIPRVGPDADLKAKNGNLPVSGRNVTVAVLDTGINGLHPDLAGKVVQNVKLLDSQSVPLGFLNPLPVEGLPNTDLLSGHGTFVAGIIAGSGAFSNGKYNGVAPGARLLGLSAGEVNLSYVLAGFDYLLDRGAQYNAKVVNCSFSTNALFDYNDPVNIATKILTDRGVNVVFSAGNTGAGNGSMNPYAQAPWVVSVGATDQNGKLADFSSRGKFGDRLEGPSLVAPGVNVASIRSTVSLTGVLGLAGSDISRLSLLELPFYTTATGTSFSAPQVAGAIALMLEANPNLTPVEVKEILQSTTTAMPRNYRHEVGAGLLNTHAAVLRAAFPEREIGIYRATMERDQVKFVTAPTQIFESTVNPGSTSVNNVTVPQDTVQANFNITWGFGLTDLGLKVNDMSGTTRGTSNVLNLPILTGRTERVVLNNPDTSNFRSVVQHTAGIGLLPQTYTGWVDATSVSYAAELDINALSPGMRPIVREGIRTLIISPETNSLIREKYITRAELAGAIVRAGMVPQYMRSTPMFGDMKGLGDRNVVESVQANPGGKLFYDAGTSGNFAPDAFASRLVMAVALVKAKGLDGQVASASLPASVLDRNTIPSQYRGYVAIALQKGWMSTTGGNFSPNAELNWLELAQGVVLASR